MEISHSSWPWHRSDATALSGYANMMMMTGTSGFVDNIIFSHNVDNSLVGDMKRGYAQYGGEV